MLRPLEPDEARAVLGPYFSETRELFVDKGLSRLKRTEFIVEDGVRDSCRHFAACRDDGLLVLVAPGLADMPEESVAAIFAHELGHAADFAYPASFLIADGELIRRHDIERAPSDERYAYNQTRQWADRSDDTVELTADLIAEWVTGWTIRYSGECLVQTYGRGVAPRPAGLR